MKGVIKHNEEHISSMTCDHENYICLSCCKDCKKMNKSEPTKQEKNVDPKTWNTPCPECGSMFMPHGVKTHMARVHQPKAEGWEEIKNKYTQSGWFDNIYDIKELDEDVKNMIAQELARQRREFIEMLEKQKANCKGKHNVDCYNHCIKFLQAIQEEEK